MCLRFYDKEKKQLANLKKRIGKNGKVIFYKFFEYNKYLNRIVTPYQGNNILNELDKDGIFYSDRESAVLSSYEIEYHKINNGIHAYRDKKVAQTISDSYTDHFFIPVECKVSDIIMFGTYKQVVCLKVKINKQLLFKARKFKYLNKI